MSNFHKIAVPATRSSSAVLQVRRRIVVVLLVLAVVSGPLFGILSLRNAGSSGVAAGAPAKAVAIAEEAARDFLAGRNSTVPTADGVDIEWGVDVNGDPVETPFAVTSMALTGSTQYLLGDTDDQLVHLIRFRTVVNTIPYNVDVTIVDDPTVGPVLGATPVLLPTSGGPRQVSPPDYQGNYVDAESSVEDNVEYAVEQWVDAYAAEGTSSDRLKIEIVGDREGPRQYSGLDGWTGELDQIVSAVPVGGGDSGLPGGVIVQARVVLTPPAANGPSLRSTYDLYVVTESPAEQPPVVAWGTAGSAEELTPYMNAN